MTHFVYYSIALSLSQGRDFVLDSKRVGTCWDTSPARSPSWLWQNHVPWLLTFAWRTVPVIIYTQLCTVVVIIYFPGRQNVCI